MATEPDTPRGPVPRFGFRMTGVHGRFFRWRKRGGVDAGLGCGIVWLMDTISRGAGGLPPGVCLSAEELLPAVYQELRRLAASKLGFGGGHHTLQPTALVHEAWLRLLGDDGDARFENRTHFFAAAAEAMRHILIDRARRKQAIRHGGGQLRVELSEMEIEAPAPDEELLAVSEALDRLAEVDPPKAELVKLRYFVGMTLEEAAATLGISEATAKRRWALARAWLFNEIRSPGS